jgi:hypothetical protein
MTMGLAKQIGAPARLAEYSKRLSRRSRRSVDVKQVYTFLRLREIAALATERIVRRVWESYANQEQANSVKS